MNGPLAGVRPRLRPADGRSNRQPLADLGADVLKIESGAYLDPFRVVGKMDDDDGWWNRSPQFRFTNRNKRGLALGLKIPKASGSSARSPRTATSWSRTSARRARSRGPGLRGAEGDQPRIVFAASRAKATPGRSA